MGSTTIYQEIEASQRRGERIVLATVIKTVGAAPCGVGSKMLVHTDGSYQGGFAGQVTNGKIVEEGIRAIREGRAYVTHIHLDADQGEAVGSCGATLEVFFEVLRPEPRLIIAGAGYVAQALTRLVTRLDFHTIVIDDRRDLADPQIFTDSVQLSFGDIPQTIRELAPDESSWVVIVTRGHSLDKEALQAALESKAAYIGMIGSPGKVRRIFKDLLKEGFAREQLAQVHAPIGLDLGAETPDEIALSIAAEMLMLRKKASGASLNTLHSLLEEENYELASGAPTL